MRGELRIKIVVLGAGALGSLVGGHLAESGSDVTLITRSRYVEAIRTRGLIIKSLKGTRTVDIKATDDPLKIRNADVLILTTKTKDTPGALDGVSHLSSSLRLSFSLQNGLTKDQLLIDKFGKEKVIGAAITDGATMVSPGEVEHTSPGTTFFGALNGPNNTRGIEDSEKMTNLFNNAGLRAAAVDDIVSIEWGKLIRMASAATVSILTRLQLHKILKNFDLAWCYVQLMKELANIARTDGIALTDHPQMIVRSLIEQPVEEAVKMVVQSGLKSEQAGNTSVKVSALQDVERQRKTEVDELLGYPLSLARKLKVQTPYLDFVYRLLKGLDSYLL